MASIHGPSFLKLLVVLYFLIDPVTFVAAVQGETERVHQLRAKTHHHSHPRHVVHRSRQHQLHHRSHHLERQHNNQPHKRHVTEDENSELEATFHDIPSYLETLDDANLKVSGQLQTKEPIVVISFILIAALVKAYKYLRQWKQKRAEAIRQLHLLHKVSCLHSMTFLSNVRALYSQVQSLVPLFNRYTNSSGVGGACNLDSQCGAPVVVPDRVLQADGIIIVGDAEEGGDVVQEVVPAPVLHVDPVRNDPRPAKPKNKIPDFSPALLEAIFLQRYISDQLPDLYEVRDAEQNQINPAFAALCEAKKARGTTTCFLLNSGILNLQGAAKDLLMRAQSDLDDNCSPPLDMKESLPIAIARWRAAMDLSAHVSHDFPAPVDLGFTGTGKDAFKSVIMERLHSNVGMDWSFAAAANPANQGAGYNGAADLGISGGVYGTLIDITYELGLYALVSTVTKSWDVAVARSTENTCFTLMRLGRMCAELEQTNHSVRRLLGFVSRFIPDFRQQSFPALTLKVAVELYDGHSDDPHLAAMNTGNAYCIRKGHNTFPDLNSCSLGHSLAVLVSDEDLDDVVRHHMIASLRMGDMPGGPLFFAFAQLELRQRKLKQMFSELESAMDRNGCLTLRFKHQLRFERHIRYDSVSANDALIQNIITRGAETNPQKQPFVDAFLKWKYACPNIVEAVVEVINPLSDLYSAIDRLLTCYKLAPPAAGVKREGTEENIVVATAITELEVAKTQMLALDPTLNPLPICAVEDIAYCAMNIMKAECSPENPKKLPAILAQHFDMYQKTTSTDEPTAGDNAKLMIQTQCSAVVAELTAAKHKAENFFSKVATAAMTKFGGINNTNPQQWTENDGYSAANFFDSTFVPIAEACGTLDPADVGSSGLLACAHGKAAGEFFSTLQSDVAIGDLAWMGGALYQPSSLNKNGKGDNFRRFRSFFNAATWDLSDGISCSNFEHYINASPQRSPFRQFSSFVGNREVAAFGAESTKFCEELIAEIKTSMGLTDTARHTKIITSACLYADPAPLSLCKAIKTSGSSATFQRSLIPCLEAHLKKRPVVTVPHPITQIWNKVCSTWMLHTSVDSKIRTSRAPICTRAFQVAKTISRRPEDFTAIFCDYFSIHEHECTSAMPSVLELATLDKSSNTVAFPKLHDLLCVVGNFLVANNGKASNMGKCTALKLKAGETYTQLVGRVCKTLFTLTGDCETFLTSLQIQFA